MGVVASMGWLNAVSNDQPTQCKVEFKDIWVVFLTTTMSNHIQQELNMVFGKFVCQDKFVWLM